MLAALLLRSFAYLQVVSGFTHVVVLCAGQLPKHQQQRADMFLLAVRRTYNFTADVTTLGAKTATVMLPQSDSNLSNNFDDAVVSPFVNCGAPSGVGVARPACSAGSAYVGPDSTVISNSSVFQSQCCVSRGPDG